MNAAQLFRLAPLGALIAFSDGTPRPPDRFNKKLRAWKDRNGSGYLMAVSPGNGKDSWSKDSFTLRISESDWLVINMTYSVEDTKDYTVKAMPAPWSILAYNDYDGKREIAHIWTNEAEAREWFQRKNYQPHKYGRKHLAVNETGTLIPFQFEEERAASHD